MSAFKEIQTAQGKFTIAHSGIQNRNEATSYFKVNLIPVTVSPKAEVPYLHKRHGERKSHAGLLTTNTPPS